MECISIEHDISFYIEQGGEDLKSRISQRQDHSGELRRVPLFAKFLDIDSVFAAASCVFVTRQRCQADEFDWQRIEFDCNPHLPSLIECHAGYGCHQIDSVWLITQLDYFAGKRQIGGYPCHENGQSPTIKYSALFEFKHSTNSRKSRFRGIVLGPSPNGEKDIHPLPWSQGRT